ncbi:MAG: flagellar filament capping protein FliD [Candidatus Midichloria sp.]|uniref:Flagellar capping protein FliD n=1 Tax=Hyalomma marginatum TaxID=34627 RepID=A0A8S4C144_9ACAR|nr:flagellar capping protein FliD [Hyalomma marginatum]CAG7596637.1 flagellar capping protein FliD [Hyalomma marginatum]
MIYSSIYRSQASWSNPSKTLKELLDVTVEKKISEISDDVASTPGVDHRMGIQQVKAKLTEPVTRQSRHIIQLDTLNSLEPQWEELKLLLDSFQEVSSKLRGTSSIDSKERRENDVFFQRDVALSAASHNKGYFEAQVRFGSDLGRHSVEIVKLAEGATWSTKELDISVHAPIVKVDCSSSASSYIQAGELEIEVRNNRLVSNIVADTEEENITSLTDAPDKFGVGTFYLNNAKIEIEEGDSLARIVEKINTVQGITVASIEKDEVSNKYKLVLISKKLGIENSTNIEEITSGIFKDKLISEPQYIKVKLKEGMSIEEVTANINAYKEEHGVIASFAEKCLTLHSTITGVENDIKLKNEEQIFGDLFKKDNGKRNKIVEEKDAEIKFDGVTKKFKSNDFNVEFPGGEIFFNLYDKPSISGEKQTITIKVAQKGIIDAVDELLVSYYKILSFLAIREKEKKISSAPLNNIPEEVKFNSLVKDFDVNTIIGKANFKDIGIDFKQEKISAFEDKNFNYIRSTDEISKGLIFFDRAKFKEALDKNFERVKDLFVYSAKGSKNLYPLTQNNIKYETIESVDFNIDKNRITFKSTVSTPLTSQRAFKAGQFFLNGQVIYIEDGSDMDALARSINEVKEYSGIEAKVIANNSSYQIHLTKSDAFKRLYNPEVKWPPILADYDRVLDGIFDIKPESYKSVDFADKDTVIGTGYLSTTGSFFINGMKIEIKSDDTLQCISDKINSAKAGVRASISTSSSGAYNLDLTAVTEANIKVSDPDKIFKSIFSTNFKNRGKRFLDISEIVKVDISQFGKKYPKKALYIPASSTSLKDKDVEIKILDWPSDKEGSVETKGLRMFYFGDGDEHVKLEIKQGIADKFYHTIENYLSFNGFVKNAQDRLKTLIREETDEIHRIDVEEIKKIEVNIKRELANIANIRSKSAHIKSLFNRE